MTAKTTNHENPEKEKQLLSSEERDILGEVATKDPPFSQRAQALLATGVPNPPPQPLPNLN